MNYVETLARGKGLIEQVRLVLPEASKSCEPHLMSPLVLAYMGDTIYDIFVRTALVTMVDGNAHSLHLLAIKRVCAAAQAAAFYSIEPLLTETERSIFKRGRNSHMGSVPKNAKISDYRAATGFEALLGWLYLSEQHERLCEIMQAALFENTKSFS